MIRRVEVNGLWLHAWQDGQGPDVVLIHGLTANLALWHFTLAADLLRYHRVTMYDLRGHGRSDMPTEGYALQDLSGDLTGLMDALGVEAACLVGHSYGADTALHFARHHPDRVRGVVAIEAGLPSLGTEQYHPQWAGWEEWAQVLERECGVRKTRPEWVAVYDRLRRGETVAPLVKDPGQLSRKGRRLVELLTETSIVHDYERAEGLSLDEVAEITTPILLVYGRHSNYIGACRILSDAISHSTTLYIQNSDHFDVLFQTRHLSGPIRQFLSACRQTWES